MNNSGTGISFWDLQKKTNRPLRQYPAGGIESFLKRNAPARDRGSCSCRSWNRRETPLENKLFYRRARFARWSVQAIPASEEKNYRKRERQKAELLEEIRQMEAELSALKERKMQTSHHIHWEELPEPERFRKPMLGRKRLMDALRIIAYRAETAMCALLRPPGGENTTARHIVSLTFHRAPPQRERRMESSVPK